MTKQVECNLAEELRCHRAAGRHWRCCNPRVEGSSYCEHHRDMLRTYSSKRTHIRKDRSHVSNISLARQCPTSNLKIKEPEITETTVSPTNNKRKTKEPETTVLPTNNKRKTKEPEATVSPKITEPEITETTVLPNNNKFNHKEPEITETIVSPNNNEPKITEPEITETETTVSPNNNKRKIKEPEINETVISSHDGVGLDNSSEIGLPTNFKRRKIIINSSEGLTVGITKQCISGKYKIREAGIAETTVLPLNILLLDDLRNVLTVKTWRENLTAAERCKLRALLPKGQKNVVESLLNGENFHFGNPVIKWGTDVCKGQQHPEALLKRESELKISQSQYFKDLRTYHHGFIARIDELEQLSELCNHDESKFLQELIRWRRSTEGNRKM